MESIITNLSEKLIDSASENEFVQILFIALVSIFIIISITRYLLKFRSDNRFFKIKILDKTIKQLPLEASIEDKSLFNECLIEELFFANTGIYASKIQREQILVWTTQKNISITIIQKAWYDLSVENGFLVAKWNKWDEIFFWSILMWTVLLYAICLISIFLSVNSVSSINLDNLQAVVKMPLTTGLIAFFTYKQNESSFSLRKIFRRLNVSNGNF